MKTPQIPALPGMTPLGLRPRDQSTLDALADAETLRAWMRIEATQGHDCVACGPICLDGMADTEANWDSLTWLSRVEELTGYLYDAICDAIPDNAASEAQHAAHAAFLAVPALKGE